MPTVRHAVVPVVLTLLAAPATAATVAPLSLPDAALSPAIIRVFDDRVTETLDLPTWDLQQARRRMLAGETIPWADMRALADAGDGLAAFRLAQRIEARNDPSLLGDAAFYYATAAYTNRDYAVGPLVRILDRRDIEFSPRRLEHMENALRAMAIAGDAKAKESLTRFYQIGHPFGRQPERALEFRLDLAEAGDADAAMALVLETMSGSAPLPMDRDQVDRLLDIVDGSDDLGLRTTGANLRRMVDAGAIQMRPAARPVAVPAEAVPETPEEATP
jgi:TPR repeat protein